MDKGYKKGALIGLVLAGTLELSAWALNRPVPRPGIMNHPKQQTGNHPQQSGYQEKSHSIDAFTCMKLIQAASTYHKPDDPSERKENSSFDIKPSDIILYVVYFFQLVFIYFTLRSTQKSADTAAKSAEIAQKTLEIAQRSRLTIEKIETRNVGDIDEKEFLILYTVTNYGNSSATIYSHIETYLLIDSPSDLPEKPPIIFPEGEKGIIVPPGRSVYYRTPILKEPENFTELVGNGKALCLFGGIQYRDDFQEDRIATFAERFEVVQDKDGNFIETTILITKPGYNIST